MLSTRNPNTIIRLAAFLCLAAVGLFVAFPVVYAQERPPRRAPLSAEQLQKVWEAEAKCVGAALKLSDDDASKVLKAYVSARKNYAEKAESLPRTREAFEQRRELGEKAAADLKEALVKAVGADKTEKIIGLLGPFSMMSFRLDRMVNELLGFELPKDKLNKAMLIVLEYNRDSGKLMTEAREAGSFENVREKVQALNEKLNKELAKVLSEKQMATWTERQGRPFGGGRRPQQ